VGPALGLWDQASGREDVVSVLAGETSLGVVQFIPQLPVEQQKNHTFLVKGVEEGLGFDIDPISGGIYIMGSRRDPRYNKVGQVKRE